MLLKGSSEDILVQLNFKYSRNKQYADLLINIPIPIVSSYHIYIMCTIHVHVHRSIIFNTMCLIKQRKKNKQAFPLLNQLLLFRFGVYEKFKV